MPVVQVPVFPEACAEFSQLAEIYARPGTPTCITCGRTREAHARVEQGAPAAASPRVVVSFDAVLHAAGNGTDRFVVECQSAESVDADRQAFARRKAIGDMLWKGQPVKVTLEQGVAPAAGAMQSGPARHASAMAVQVSNLLAILDGLECQDFGDDAPVIASARELERAFVEGRADELLAQWDAEEQADGGTLEGG
jgi:hypothetical protein